MPSFIDYMMDESTAETSMKEMQSGLANKGRANNNLFYYYRKMDIGGSCMVRFLPISTEVAESDEVKKRFWLAKKTIRLRFDNPELAESKVVITIPVMQMYTGGRQENDIILKQVKALYDEADKLAKAGQDERSKAVREKASYHWTRGECLAQGFVVRDGINESDTPENPIRLFELNKQVMNKINAVCDPKADPDLALRYWPVHGKLGTNFVIKKTRSGEWPAYTDSGFATSNSPWTDAMKAAIGTYGLFQLETFLPERPGDEEYEMLAEIVRRSIAGETTWDTDWEAHLVTVKPYKTTVDGSTVDAETTTRNVREALARVGGASAETVAVSEPDDDVSVTPDHDADPVSAVADPPQKTGRDVRAIVDQMKRGGKAKPADATA
jgi:hypothetical protein